MTPTSTPATQPATLTQYFQHLLEKEENREKFNRYNQSIQVFIYDKENKKWSNSYTSWPFYKKPNKIFFVLSHRDNGEYDLGMRHLDKDFYHDPDCKEIICIALKSLDEFNQLNSEDCSFAISLRHKYGSMLYDKSIEEIDEIFKSENICI
jgi:hypothetical protein